MSWMTPLGSDLQSVWKALLDRQSALTEVPSEFRLRNYQAATVPEIDYRRPARERLDEIALRTLEDALESAGISPSDPDIATVVGVSFGDLLERDCGETCSLSEWAACLGQTLGLRRAPLVVSNACSSGSDAIVLGHILVKSGQARVCVCGGVDILTETKRMGHSALGTMSPTRLRAFETRHDGTLLGEGAAFLVLVDSCSLNACGYVLGHGCANDAATMTAPDLTGLGASLAIRRALFGARIRADEVVCYCAHGSGTPVNDINEVAAIGSVFPAPAPLAVFGTKGNLGHSLGATGAIEAVATLLALRTKLAPPLASCETVLPEIMHMVSVRSPLSFDGNIGVSVTLGFGGYDTCLLMGVPS